MSKCELAPRKLELQELRDQSQSNPWEEGLRSCSLLRSTPPKNPQHPSECIANAVHRFHGSSSNSETHGCQERSEGEGVALVRRLWLLSNWVCISVWQLVSRDNPKQVFPSGSFWRTCSSEILLSVLKLLFWDSYIHVLCASEAFVIPDSSKQELPLKIPFFLIPAMFQDPIPLPAEMFCLPELLGLAQVTIL